jgi:hypothetical protein
MKKILFLLLFALPLALFAQTDPKYMEGAVPVIEGKVKFTAEMNIGSMSREQIYETLLEWAKNRFKPEANANARVLYNNADKGSIAIAGDEFIIFSSTSLALDKTRIYYNLVIFCETGKCNIEMSRIRYWYEEERNGGEKFNAEERITDELALNKTKTKLYPIFGKFRRKTIDLKDELFKEIQTSLGNKMIALGLKQAPVTPESQVTITQASAVQPQPVAPVPVTKAAENEKVNIASDNIESLIAQAQRMTITAGNDEQFEISKECWGGFGELFGKKVAFCLIDTQKTMGNMLMTQSDNYKVSFYSTNNSQPSVVINCKKLMAQTINGEEAQKMSPSCIVGKSYNMYVGEILK